MIYLTLLEQNQKNRNLEHEKAYHLLEYGLMEEYCLDKEKIILQKHKYGKPYLMGRKDIYFNISHCQGMAACGIWKRELGVDIEQIRPFRPQIISKVLTDNEILQLEHSEKKEEFFLRFWTLKESFIKAIGIGLAYPMKQIEFQIPDKYSEEILSNQKKYTFYQHKINDRHILSICVKHTEFPEALKRYRNI